MAQIVQTTFVITVSKLVKDSAVADPVLNADQIQLITDTLPGVVDELLADSAVVIEVQSISD